MPTTFQGETRKMTATLEALLDDMLAQDDATEAEWLSMPVPQSVKCQDGHRHDFTGFYSPDGWYGCIHCGRAVVVVRRFGKKDKQAKPGSLKLTKHEAATLAARPLTFNA